MTEEGALVRSFVVAEKRDRLAGFLASPKDRHKATALLPHFRSLDPRWVVAIPADRQEPAAIERALRARGAGETCHVISEDPNLDGQRLSLRSALDRVVGQGMGTILSCVPGVLACYEGEGPADRCILDARAPAEL